MENDNGEKSYDPKIIAKSVIDVVDTATPASIAADGFVLWIAQAADQFIPWGQQPKARDAQLRQFVVKENYFASALGIVAARNASFSWRVEGRDAPRTSQIMQDVLLNAQYGKGWEEFIIRLTIDMCTQDLGAYVEIVRESDSDTAPVIGIGVLDAARCWPTGNPEKPVIYNGTTGRWKELKWYQVCQVMEMPSPLSAGSQSATYSLQYCALTRALRACQILANVAIYKDEKLGGRFQRQIHLVSGVNKDQLQQAITERRELADAEGLTRYMQPAIVTSVDPNADVKLVTLELATLPQGFDEEITVKNYITVLAMAFLTDYQEFAPLPGGNLGTSMQSEILHMKSRGKGPALFMKKIAHLINEEILPKNVEFKFEEQDIEATKTMAELSKMRAEERKARIESGEITPEVARQIAVDSGDLAQEVFEAMGGTDVTPPSRVTRDDEKPQPIQPATGPVKLQAPTAPPAPPAKVPPPVAGGKADDFEQVTDERVALEEETAVEIGTILARVKEKVARRLAREGIATN